MFSKLRVKRDLKRYENKNLISNLKKKLFVGIVTTFLTGCQMGEGPRMRVSPYFGATAMNYLNCSHLGKHQYNQSLGEKIGMLYTCKGGYIDLGHLRESADRTAYASKITLENLIKGKNEFSFKMIEPAKYVVKINYPKNWDKIGKDEQEKIAKDVSIDFGQYLAHTSTIWHEIVTWFGYSCVGLFSEHVSSFSWEDLYSDLLGAKLGAQALRESHNFDDSITLLINKELKKLDVQSPEVARSATQKIKGKWYDGSFYPFITMKKRNFDIGTDGFITPWLVPGVCPDAKPELCHVSNLNSFLRYGFSMSLKIEPRESQKKDILKIIYPMGEGKCIQPSVHFPKIVDYIKNEAMKKYPEMDKPIL